MQRLLPSGCTIRPELEISVNRHFADSNRNRHPGRHPWPVRDLNPSRLSRVGPQCLTRICFGPCLHMVTRGCPALRLLCQSGVELWRRFVRPTAGPLSFGESRASIPTRMLQPVRSLVVSLPPFPYAISAHGPRGPVVILMVPGCWRQPCDSHSGRRPARFTGSTGSDLPISLLLRNLPDRGPRRPVRLGGSPASRLILNRGISPTRSPSRTCGHERHCRHEPSQSPLTPAPDPGPFLHWGCGTSQ